MPKPDPKAYKQRRFVADDGRAFNWEDGLWKHEGKTFQNDFHSPLDTNDWPLRGNVVHSSATVTYETLEENLQELLGAMKVLCGDVVGPAGKSWQDVARVAGESADNLGHQLRMAGFGHHGSFLTFPSPEEALEYIAEESHDESI